MESLYINVKFQNGKQYEASKTKAPYMIALHMILCLGHHVNVVNLHAGIEKEIFR